MGKLPAYFEHLREDGIENSYYALYYDESTKHFEWGSVHLPLTSFDPYIPSYMRNETGEAALKVEEFPNTPVVLPDFGAVIVGPRLHEWSERNPQHVRGAARVMIEAYLEFFEAEEMLEFEEDSSGFMGFAAGLRGTGGIGLQVAGNCACLGPNPSSFIFENTFEEGFAEYDLHNSDSKAQTASLFAGLGYLARLASGKTAAQQPLFR